MKPGINLPTAADVALIRQGLKLSQGQFADLLGLSVRTVQGWELLTREPEGAARVLLLVAKYQPQAITKAFAMALRVVGDGSKPKID